MRKILCSAMALVALQGAAHADFGSDLLCGQPWVAGEALLLRPSGLYPYVALNATIDSENGTFEINGCEQTNCPSYDWGYKVEVGYRLCKNELLVNWTSFNNGHRSTFRQQEGEELLPAQLFNPGGIQVVALGLTNAESRACFKYDVLDAEVARWMCKECSKFSGRAFFGVRYARAVTAQDVLFFNAGGRAITTRQKSDVQGTGPRAGLGARYDLCWGIGLTGSLAGHLLIGSAKSELFSQVFQDTANSSTALIRNKPECRLIPASEVKFGFDYRMCLFCGLSGFAEVGYQLTHYFYGSMNTMGIQEANQTQYKVSDRPVSFDGWYFRLGLQY